MVGGLAIGGDGFRQLQIGGIGAAELVERAARFGRRDPAVFDRESIQRNLQSALPEMISQLSNSPENLAASFKLYRNLDALYYVELFRGYILVRRC